ncbi:hypothetical protein [Mariniplasma anaerobium]|uniref:Uncharacterized protein n=1 Tax=Mariniplasma anaerobium TaxID=2735436 RepID=A0A7U9XVY0_9MOLU|nr:hypothetical protein [Mariniplasma anaerobium]BCR36885.1 hypothetical protein MPAN_017780 [Mariniplasma anaerobium]
MKKYIKSLPVVILFFSILLAAMITLGALQTDNGEVIMNGIKATFGGNVGSIGGFASVDVAFSFINAVAYLAPVILVIILIYTVMSHKTKSPLFVSIAILIIASFVFSFVILLNLGAYTTGTVEVLGIEGTYTYEAAVISTGAILGLIFSAGGALTALIYTVSEFKKLS